MRRVSFPTKTGAVRCKVGVVALVCVAALAACGGASDDIAETGQSAPDAITPTTTPSTTSIATTEATSPSTSTEAGEHLPSAWIVYGWGAPCAEEAPSYGLCLMHEDGSEAHAILTELGVLRDPDWSHDGTSLAFARDATPGQLWISDPDGADPHPIFAETKRCPTDARVPSWSPDDSRLAFMCLDGSQTEIAIADVATGEVTSVYLAADLEEVWNPRWSPDGTRLVFERDPNDGVQVTGGEIVVVPVGGGTPTVVAPVDMFAGYPDWSPDGDLIVFETYGISVFETGGAGATNLYLVSPDGTGLRPLTDNALGGNRDSQPSFTADGERVIFTHTTGGAFGGYGIRRAAFIDLDGGLISVVDHHYATHPRLQPHGS